MTVGFDEDVAQHVDTLGDLLEKTLEKVRNIYAQAGITLPERQYYALQQQPIDCEQVVVYFTQAFYGGPGDQARDPIRCDGPRSANIVVQVARCVPASGARRAPETDAVQKATRELARDAYLLLDAAGELDSWDDLGGPGLGVIATVNADEWSGGYGSVTLNLTVGL